MSDIKVCDICGEKIELHNRYELIYKGVITNKKNDICPDCIKKLKIEINNKQKDGSGRL